MDNPFKKAKRAKNHQTRIYTGEDLKEIQVLIKWHFDNIATDKKPIEHLANYSPLADDINNFYHKKDWISTSALKDLVKNPKPERRRNIEKTEAIRESLKQIKELHDEKVSQVNTKKVKITTVTLALDPEIVPFLDLIWDKKNFDIEASQQWYAAALAITESKNDDYSRARLYTIYAIFLIENHYELSYAKQILTSAVTLLKKFFHSSDIASAQQLLSDHMRAKYYLAQVEAVNGDIDIAEAYMDEYLDYAEAKKDYVEIAWTHHTFGLIFNKKNIPLKAIEHFKMAIKMAKTLAISDAQNEKENGDNILAHCYLLMSEIKLHFGSLDESKAYALLNYQNCNKNDFCYLQSLLILVEIEIGQGYYTSSRWSDYLNEAKQIALNQRDAMRVAMTIVRHVEILVHHKDFNIALRLLKENHQIIKETKNDEALSYFLQNYGLLLVQLNELEDAERYLLEALEINKSPDFDSYIGLIAIEQTRGNFEKKAAYMNALFKIYESNLEKTQLLFKRVSQLSDTAMLHQLNNNYLESISMFEKVAKLYRESDLLSPYVNTLLLIGSCYDTLQQNQKAFEYFFKVVELVKGTDFHFFEVIAKTNCALYLINYTLEFNEAKQYLDEAKYINDKYSLNQTENIETARQKLQEARKKKTNNNNKIKRI